MKPNKCMLFVSFDEIDGVCANFKFDLCINGNKLDDTFTLATARELLKTEIMEKDFIDNCPELHKYDSIQDYFAQLAETLKQLNYDSKL